MDKVLIDCRTETCEVDQMAQGSVHFQALSIAVVKLLRSVTKKGSAVMQDYREYG
jgi:hypothetical protein